MIRFTARFSPKTIAAATVLAGSMFAASAQATTLRIATTHAPDQYATQVIKQIKKDLEGAGVDLKVKLYTSGQLGSGEQLMGEHAVRTLSPRLGSASGTPWMCSTGVSK